MRHIAMLIVSAVTLGTALTPRGARANPELDQSYVPPSSGVEYAGFSNGGSFRRAQTFTVGIAGTLVELGVFTPSSSSTFTGVNILATSGGTPGGTPASVLDVGSFDGTALSGLSSKWSLSTFTVSLPVTVGEVLGIEPLGAGNGATWVAVGTYPPVYAGGADYVYNPGVFGPAFTSDYISDGFVTYVDPPGSSSVPEPGSLAVLGAAIAMLVTMRRVKAVPKQIPIG